MSSLRTNETNNRYREYREQGGLKNGCNLCTKPIIQQFKYWKLMNNDFPYDKIAVTHHMLIPIRHIQEDDLTQEETAELSQLKKDVLDTNYNFILEATPRNKSIPDHFHLHLVKLKDVI